MTTPDFSKRNKNAAQSFAEQRNLIKHVCRGKTVLCPVCQQPLKLQTPGDQSGGGNKAKNANKANNGIGCDQGCTRIDLEFGR
jgi:hypothetical protein